MKDMGKECSIPVFIWYNVGRMHGSCNTNSDYLNMTKSIPHYSQVIPWSAFQRIVSALIGTIVHWSVLKDRTSTNVHICSMKFVVNARSICDFLTHHDQPQNSGVNISHVSDGDKSNKRYPKERFIESVIESLQRVVNRSHSFHSVYPSPVTKR